MVELHVYGNNGFMGVHPILRQLKVSREPTIPHPTILTAQYSDTFTIFVFIAVLGSVSGLIQGLVVRLGLELVLEARLYG